MCRRNFLEVEHRFGQNQDNLVQQDDILKKEVEIDSKTFERMMEIHGVAK